MDDQGYIRLSENELNQQLHRKEEEVMERMKRELSQLVNNKDAEKQLLEDREKRLHQRTDMLVKKFKGYVWQLALPGLFLEGLDKEGKRRRTRSLENLNNSFPLILESLRNSCIKIGVKGLTDVISGDS